MKFAFFDNDRFGVVTGEKITDVTNIVKEHDHHSAQSLLELAIAKFDVLRPRLAKEAADSAASKPLASVRLRPPVPKPTNIVCMAVNYNDGLVPTGDINAFHKSPSAIIGPGDAMLLPAIPATIFEAEAEMAIVIGKPTWNVSVEDAMKSVFGYINFIDGSARGTVPATNSFFQMKSRGTFAPMGPFLVTADEISDPQNLRLRMWLNGSLKQDFSTRDMANPVAECISWLSRIIPLAPGDVVATGTHHGGLVPLQDGDLVEVETEGLGRLKVTVKDELKRRWKVETRGERKGMTPPITPQIAGKYAVPKS
jgi:2-keto-4-pentenoate hydratase/2-oxohepta-3-ene-1,7-dioic acid hydratase in catechol pathway